MKSTHKMRRLSPEERLQNQKASLRHFAEKCNTLADRLELGGSSLTQDEIELIRFSRMVDFNRAIRMLKVGYLGSEEECFNDAMADLANLQKNK